jgi:hypothetical protein
MCVVVVEIRPDGYGDILTAHAKGTDLLLAPLVERVLEIMKTKQPTKVMKENNRAFGGADGLD